ncbi:MAG TPA: prepilin peptidase [Thermoanaerobaculia bacterium]|nr:prepilin peptidase [Thermoanaerobaculia bacterium]
MPLETLVVVYLALVGLIVGSYLNVVIHRLPRGESTVLPRSRCPACGAAIRARDNLPVVSWLLLGGRCRHCRAPISFRYPLVEAATAALFVACYLRFGASVDALAGVILGGLLIVLAGIDTAHYYLPDRLTLPGIAVGIALQPWLSRGSVAEGIQGALLGGGLLLAVAGVWVLLHGREGMGLGDAKMLAMIGAFLGWCGVVVSLVAATAAGAAAGLVLLGRRRGGWDRRLPFGLFLALGALVALFWGRELVAAYARQLG